MRTTKPIIVAAGLAATAWARDAAACSVCYGDAEGGFILGAQWAALLMIGITYTLLSGGVVTFIALRRRALRRGAGAAETDIGTTVPAPSSGSRGVES